MEKILVIGGGGQLGTELVAALRRLRAEKQVKAAVAASEDGEGFYIASRSPDPNETQV